MPPLLLFRIRFAEVCFFCILCAASVVGQNTLIHGIVQDEITRNPIPNVNIRVNGTTEGCFSGVDGKFTLNLDKTPCSLTITCVGYEAV